MGFVRELSKRYMKYLLFSVSTLFLVASVNGQSNTQISYKTDGASVLEVIKDIEKKYDLRFSYATQSIEREQVVLDIQSQLLEEFLEALLVDCNMDYKVFDDNILLRKKEAFTIKDTPPYRKSLHLKGQILNTSSTQNLAYASIYVANSSIGTFSDEKGNFDLEIPAELLEEELHIQYLGYDTQTYQIEELDETFVLISLRENELSMEEIVIVNRKKPIVFKTFENALTLSLNQLNDITSGLMGSDLAKQLQMLPGISANDDTSADIKIRGSNGDETLLILDGMPIYNASHFYGIFSSINTSYLEEVNLYKNIFPIEYGGKTAGVVEMISRNEVLDTFKLETELNLLNASLNTTIPISQKSVLYFAGRATYSDVSNTKFYTLNKSENNRDFTNFSTNPNFRFNDINAKYALKINEKNALQLNFYQSTDKFTNQLNQTIETFGNRKLELQNKEEEVWSNLAGNIAYQTKLSKGFELSANIYFTEYKNDAFSVFDLKRKFDNQNPIDTIDFGYRQSNRVSDIGTDMHISRSKGETIMTFGLAYIQHKIDYLFNENGVNNFSGNNRVSEISPYSEYIFSPINKMILRTGLRGTYYDATNKFYLSPRILLNYSLSEQASLKSSFSLNRQYIREFQYRYRGATKELWVDAGNEQIPILQSQNYMLGGLFRLGPITVDIEFYHKDMSGTLEYAVVNPGEAVANSTTTRDYRLFTGTGTAKGIDILLSSTYKKFDTYLAYTLSETTYTIPEIAKGSPYPSEDDRRHQLKWLNKLHLNKWTFGVDWIVTSGRPYFDADKIQDRDIRNLNPKSLFSYLPAYRRLDIGVFYAFQVVKTKSEVGVSLFNALNNQNLKYVQSITSSDMLNGSTINTILGSETNLLNRTLNVSWRMKF
ncbi:MAG: ferric enterobactin receptor [Saprospiraceae bacterium]|jgi:ferric enterobactin receptor